MAGIIGIFTDEEIVDYGKVFTEHWQKIGHADAIRRGVRPWEMAAKRMREWKCWVVLRELELCDLQCEDYEEYKRQRPRLFPTD